MTAPFKSSVENLGDLKSSGMGLFAGCTAQNSGHGSVLDLDVLIERYGADWSYIGRLDQIGRLCVCKECGHRGAHLILIPNTQPRGMKR
jgi:hypothetical protein